MTGSIAGVFSRALVLLTLLKATYQTDSPVEEDPCRHWPPPCSQQCESNNTDIAETTLADADVTCSCLPEYQLRDDGHSCQILGDPAIFLITSGLKVFSIRESAEGGGMSPFVPQHLFRGQRNSIISMAYDNFTENMYWLEEGDSNVYRMTVSLKGPTRQSTGQESPTPILRLNNPRVVAIDWVGQNLYIAEERRIIACLMDASTCVEVVTRVTGDIDSFLVQPSISALFWSTCSIAGKIFTTRMDGENIKTITTARASCPKALTFDRATNSLFWIEHARRTGTVKTMRLELDNSSRSLPGIHIHGRTSLAVFEDTLFYTAADPADRTHLLLKSVDKFVSPSRKDRPETLLSGALQPPAIIHIYHTAFQPSAYNPCKESSCSHMCLISTADSYVCACPGQMTLSDDDSKCVYNDDASFLAIARGNTLYRVDTAMIGHNALQTLPVTIPDNITSVTYDPEQTTMIVSTGNIIYSIDTSTWTKSLMVTLPSATIITNLASDWMSNNIYWTDETTKILYMTSVRGPYYTTIKAPITNVSCFTLDNLARFVYVAVCDANNHIIKCDMTVSHCGIVTEVTSCVRHMIMTGSGDKLVFIDNHARNVWMLPLTGVMRTTRIGPGWNITSLTEQNDRLFWTDSHKPALDHVDIARRNVRGSISLPFTDASIVTAVNQLSLSSNATSECLHAGCSHLCVMLRHEHTCLCPEHLSISSDNRTCSYKVEATVPSKEGFLAEVKLECKPPCLSGSQCRMNNSGLPQCLCGDTPQDRDCGNVTDTNFSTSGSNNKYAWIGGVLGLFGCSALLVLTFVYCIRRRAAERENTNVSVICFKEALLGPAAAAPSTDSTHCLVSMEHPSQADGNARETCRIISPEESLDVIPPGLDSPRYHPRKSKYKTDFEPLVESPSRHRDVV